MRLTDFCGGFAYEYPNDSGEYKKVTISMHPDNKFISTCPINYSEYKSYGNWYYYDGKSHNLNYIFSTFDPKTEGIKYLIERLRVESSLEDYETTWSYLKKWAYDTAKKLEEILKTTATLVMGYTFLQRICFGG